MANKVDTIRMATLRMAKKVAILEKKRRKKTVVKSCFGEKRISDIFKASASSASLSGPNFLGSQLNLSTF